MLVLPSAHTGHTLGHTGPPEIGGLGLALRFTCRDSEQEPPGKQMTDVQLDTYSSTGGASKTWVLTAWRSLLPLPAYYEALGTL